MLSTCDSFTFCFDRCMLDKPQFDPEEHEYEQFNPNEKQSTPELRNKLAGAFLIVNEYAAALQFDDRSETIEQGAKFARHMVGSLASNEFGDEQRKLISQFYSEYSKLLPRGEFEKLRSGFVGELAAHHVLNELYLDVFYAKHDDDKLGATDLIVGLDNLPSPQPGDKEQLKEGGQYLRLQVKALPLASRNSLKPFYPILTEWQNDLVVNVFRGRSTDPKFIPKNLLKLANTIYSASEMAFDPNDQQRIDELTRMKSKFIERMNVLITESSKWSNVQGGVMIVPSFSRQVLYQEQYDSLTGKPKNKTTSDQSELGLRVYTELRKTFVQRAVSVTN